MRRIVYTVIAIALLASGCASAEINDKLADGAKAASTEQPWFDRVKNWNDGNFGTIEVKTDFLDTKVGSYKPAFEICQAFVEQYAPDADDKPNLQIYGVQRETRTKVDGSKETSERDVIIAQAVNTTDYECGVNPPFGDKLYEDVKGLGIRVHS